MHSVKLSLSSLLLIFFLSACDDKTFSKIYPNAPTDIETKSFKLHCIYPDIQSVVKEALKNEKFKLNNSAFYTIKVDYMEYKKACNNPMTSAYDATYDGFIRLTLLKENRRIYMCQKDFRGELSVNILEDMLTLMRDDLEF